MKTTKMRKITSSILAAVVAAASLAIPASSINYSSASAEEETEPSTEEILEETSAESTENSSTTPAFYEAGEGNDLIVKDTTSSTVNRSYTLYQVFKGDLADGEKLTKVEWGSSIYVRGGTDLRKSIVDALKAETMFDGNTNPVASYFENVNASESNNYSAENVAAIIESLPTDSSTELDAMARIIAHVIESSENTLSRTVSESTGSVTDGKEYEFENVASGYYLVSDDTESDEVINSRYMLKVGTGSNGTIIKTKSSGAPTITKKIKVDNELKDYQSVSLGETVTYQLSSAVPDMSGYNRYYFVVNDTMTSGLTLNTDSFVVKVGEATLDETTVKTSTDMTYEINVTENEDGSTSFTLTFKNFKQYTKGSDIKITYTATVNENIISGNQPKNINTVNLTYPNNPNFNYQGDSDDDPDKPKEDDPTTPEDEEDPTVTTPDQSVYVYTTAVRVIKVDNNGDRLTGAIFKLTTDNSTTQMLTVKDVYTPVGYYGTYEPAEDEEVYYRLLSDSYGTVNNPETSDRVTKEVIKYSYDSDNSKYVADINGDYYKVAGENTYIPVDGDGEEHTYEKGVVYYTESESRALVNIDNGGYVAEVSEQNGLIEFAGLGVGEYELEEVTPPTGYEKIDATYKFKILYADPTSSKTNIATWEFDNINTVSKVTAEDLETIGVYEILVENSKHNTLPTTGGIGTTIFYIVGSVIVIGAVVLLITKRRMRSEDE
jgi:fimbrial isopeptide formation D2 family protein/LPXTG-motif cell wall-anchored protein